MFYSTIQVESESAADGRGFKKKAVPEDNEGEKVLGRIWDQIVSPVIDALGLVVCEFLPSYECPINDKPKQKQHGRQRPRVHWCPTGAFVFLPLHAAYAAHSTGVGTINYCVSSYTPTITALLNARRNLHADPFAGSTALLVAEPNSPGLRSLNTAIEEVAKAAAILAPMSPVVIGTQESAREGARVQAVLEKLPEASIFHLACHGEQDSKDPLRSRFCLRDGRLTIGELMKLNLKKARFAYLSACETAKGDSQQPDQAIHLAAAMLFVGFRSVVATMW